MNLFGEFDDLVTTPHLAYSKPNPNANPATSPLKLYNVNKPDYIETKKLIEKMLYNFDLVISNNCESQYNIFKDELINVLNISREKEKDMVFWCIQEPNGIN